MHLVQICVPSPVAEILEQNASYPYSQLTVMPLRPKARRRAIVRAPQFVGRMNISVLEADGDRPIAGSNRYWAIVIDFDELPVQRNQRRPSLRKIKPVELNLASFIGPRAQRDLGVVVARPHSPVFKGVPTTWRQLKKVFELLRSNSICACRERREKCRIVLRNPCFFFYKSGLYKRSRSLRQAGAKSFPDRRKATPAALMS